MKPLKQIKTALDRIQSIQEMDLCEVEKYLVAHCDCIVTDKDEIKKASEYFSISDGKIGVMIGDNITVKCTFYQLIDFSTACAYDMPARNRKAFIKDCRKLANMLSKAAEDVATFEDSP